MQETPPMLDDGTHGKHPKLLPDGRMSMRKKAVIGAAGVVVATLIGAGVYMALHKSDYSKPTKYKPLSGSNLSVEDSSDALPDSTAINQIDDSSLAQDITTIDTGVTTGDANEAAADTALNDKSKEITVDTSVSGTENATNRLSRLKQRGDQEMGRRLDALNKAIAALNSASHLNAASRDKLNNELGNEVTNLTALRMKLQGETTAAAAAADVSNMFTEYRVYALMLPKARLVRTADAQIAVEQKLADIHTKLQKRISQSEAQGKDVTALTSQLDELESHITAAQDLSNTAETGLLPLQPTDYNTDHGILSSYRDKLKSAHTHNKTAVSLAKEIAISLKNGRRASQ